jgi:DNA polymerase-1
MFFEKDGHKWSENCWTLSEGGKRMDLRLNLEKPRTNKQNVKKVLKQQKDKQYQPTWNEIWFSGYKRHTGTVKKGIFQTKLTDNDKDKMEQVKEAIEKGEIGTQVEDMKKFSKSHAMKLYKELVKLRKKATIQKMLDECPSTYQLVTTVEQLNEMYINILGEDFIGLDTETTGLEYFGDDYIVGVSISCPKADLHFYIPVRHNTEQKQLEPSFVFKHIKLFLEDEEMGKILHNAKFDVHMFRKEGIQVKGVIMDTMVAMHVLSENEPSYALKNLATKWGRYFGFEDKSMTYEELFGKGGFQDTPLDIGMVYACKDTHLVIKFYEWIMGHLEKQPKLNAIHDLETKVIKVSIEMEKNGFEVDLEYADHYKKELKEEVENLLQQLHEYFGDINLNSPAQLQKVLFQDLGLPNRNKGSVDADTLEALKIEHEGVAVLLAYRELNKLLSTYIEPLPQKISKIDARLHGQFKQTGTKTGRYSSKEPNLQNIPPFARKLFVAPTGKVILGIDFSKVEPTILAHMTNDKKFKKPFLEGIDIYSSLASGTFHKPIEECGDGSKERKMMKTGLLATMYGTSNYTLSQQLGITVDEAEEFIQTFLNNYPVVAQWIDYQHDWVDKEGYVETLFGRKRRFIGHKDIAKKFKAVEEQVVKMLGRKPKNIWKEKEVPYKLRQRYWNVAGQYFRASRQSVNAIIQGTGADIMKKALIDVYDLFQSWGDEYKVLATIHDEILMEVPATITLEEVNMIEEVMINCVQMSLPLKVDTEVMTRWGQGKPKNIWFNVAN